MFVPCSLEPPEAVAVNLVVHLCTASEPADEELAEELQKHLRQLGTDVTHASQLVLGQDSEAERRAQIDRAGVVLLLISIDFLVSEECRTDVRRALERHDEGSALVVLVPCRRCMWEQQPFAHLPCLP